MHWGRGEGEGWERGARRVWEVFNFHFPKTTWRLTHFTFRTTHLLCKYVKIVFLFCLWQGVREGKGLWGGGRLDSGYRGEGLSPSHYYSRLCHWFCWLNLFWVFTCWGGEAAITLSESLTLNIACWSSLYSILANAKLINPLSTGSLSVE